MYCSVPGKHPCIACVLIHGVNVAGAVQMYGIFIPMHACRPKSWIMFKCPWVLTRPTMVYLVLWAFANSSLRFDVCLHAPIHRTLVLHSYSIFVYRYMSLKYHQLDSEECSLSSVSYCSQWVYSLAIYWAPSHPSNIMMPPLFLLA